MAVIEDVKLDLFRQSIDAAVLAGAAILNIYKEGFDVELKDDESPLTTADKAAHNIIRDRLVDTGIPILSEEGAHLPYEQRKTWEALWIVDPLDGTKEFVKRNGEFTVNIALVEEGNPVFGVIYVPEKHQLFFGGNEIGSYRFNNLVTQVNFAQYCCNAEKLPAETLPATYTVVASRSHISPETEEYLQKRRSEVGEIEVVSMGSALKICAVAEGKAHEYPRLGPTMEWDTAAGQAIVEGAGGELLDWKSMKPVTYNRENLKNDWFLVRKKTT